MWCDQMAGRSSQFLNPPEIHFNFVLDSDIAGVHPMIPSLPWTRGGGEGTVRQADYLSCTALSANSVCLYDTCNSTSVCRLSIDCKPLTAGWDCKWIVIKKVIGLPKCKILRHSVRAVGRKPAHRVFCLPSRSFAPAVLNCPSGELKARFLSLFTIHASSPGQIVLGAMY